MTNPRRRRPVAEFPWGASCDHILAAVEQLDPADNRLPARQLRETAESIRDHRDANPKEN